MEVDEEEEKKLNGHLFLAKRNSKKNEDEESKLKFRINFISFKIT